MTSQANAMAVLAAINAQFTSTHAYELDKIPSPRPAEYIEVTLSRRFGGTLRVGGSMSVVGYRITVRAVSQATVANVRNSLEKCRAALEFKCLTVGGEKTTSIQFETEDPVAYDDGHFSGLLTFTYAL